MPEMRRSATLSIEQGIDLPLSPPLTVIGRTDGKAVCRVYINAAGLSIAGPKGAHIRGFNWDELLTLAKNA
jgi:hypothetical protein